MNLKPELIAAFADLFKISKKVVITNHMNPDGDAMGSALGLAGVLLKKGFEVKVIVPNSYPKFLQWMNGHEDVIVYEHGPSVANEIIMQSDLIIHLDYNALHRSGTMQGVLESATAKRMIIDHHQQPDDFAKVLYSDTSMSSTCEMVYHLLTALGWDSEIGLNEAKCIYTGLITDTGNFKFSITSSKTHWVAGQLLDLGVKSQDIAARVYDTNSRDRLKLLSRSLENMEVFPDFNAAIISLSGADLAEFNYQKGDTEGFVNYGLSISGNVLSVFMSEKDGIIKISFRSKGTFDVNKLARAHFNGGGHINAAGGMSEESLVNTKKKLIDLLPSFKNELINE